jgi:rRNA maturation endonuclease Nob1
MGRGVTGTTAAVVRCHGCNIQTTIITGPVPDVCPDCGLRLERRPDATLTIGDDQ